MRAPYGKAELVVLGLQVTPVEMMTGTTVPAS